MHARCSSAVPAIRFIRTIVIQPARMCHKKTPSSPLGPEDAIVHAVLFLRPVGNAVVPLSDGLQWEPLINNWAPLYIPQENLSMPISV